MDIRLNHRNNGYDDDDDDDDDDVDDDVILALRGEVEVDPRRGACHGLARGGRQRQAPAEETKRKTNKKRKKRKKKKTKRIREKTPLDNFQNFTRSILKAKE